MAFRASLPGSFCARDFYKLPTWARSHNFHEPKVKLRAAILSYFAFKDGRPSFLERLERAPVVVRFDYVASAVISQYHARARGE